MPDPTETLRAMHPAPLGWRLVVHETEGGEGAAFLPVVFFAVLDYGGRTRVAPMVVPYLDDSGDLSWYQEGDADVVGLAEPGDSESTWDDIANARRLSVSESDAAKERRTRAPKLLDKLTQNARRVLVLMHRGAVVSNDELSVADRAMGLVELSEYGLVVPHAESIKPHWVVTPLGDAVADLDAAVRSR